MCCETERPTSIAAAGPDHVAFLQGGVLSIVRRYNAANWYKSYRELFMVPQGFSMFDPRLYYDPAHSRWVAAQVSWVCTGANGPASYGLGFLDFAVSDGPDPTKGWGAYYVTYVDHLPIDIGLGNSRDAFLLTTSVNQMIDSGCNIQENHGNEVFSFDWSDFLGGDLQPSYWQYAGGDPWFRMLVPALQFPATDAHAHLIGVSNQLHLVHLDVDAAVGNIHSEFLTETGVIRGLQTPPQIQVPGDPPRAMSVRIYGPSSVAWQDGRLVLASNDYCIPAGDTTERACARIAELDTDVAPAALIQDFYVGQAQRDTYAPGVTLTQAGDIHVLVTRSSPTINPSPFIFRQASGDPSNSVSPAKRLTVGGIAVGPWSTYVQPAPDPIVPDIAWVDALAPWSDRGYELSNATGDTFVPITPLRVLDTRDGTGLSGGFQNNVPRTFNVAGAGGGTIPADAVAITGNLTVADQSSGGYVSVGPQITANPTSSTINFPFGDNRANNLTLPLNANGDLMAVFKGSPSRQTQLILDVTGYFLADDSGTTYEPITASRVLDSRFGVGLAGKFVVNTPRTFQVTGAGGVPAGAKAVTGNLTVVGQSKAGYVSLTPEPDATPDTSTINFPLGDTRANGVTVPLSDTGSLSAVFKASGGSTDLIFDVTGYYVDDLTGLRFYPLNPGRIMDTRFNTLTQLFRQFSSSVPRTLVTGGHFGVPGNALAVTGNLTVVGQTKAGYVSITKNPTTNPTVSAVNFPLGDVRANGVTVPLNTSNDMALVYKAASGAKTHLLLDLTGYFR
jgi:hypothetical protein